MKKYIITCDPHDQNKEIKTLFMGRIFCKEYTYFKPAHCTRWRPTRTKHPLTHFKGDTVIQTLTEAEYFAELL